MAKFKDAQMVADPLGLIQEVPTRWNSAFQMMERILQTNGALSIALLGTAKPPAPFSAEEIGVLEEFCSLLRPFEKATKLISGGKYPTMSLVIPIVSKMQIQLFSYKHSFKSIEAILAFSFLSDRFNDRFGYYETRTVPRMATLIDPRFKKQGFQRTNNADQAYRALEDELHNVFKNLAQEPSTSAPIAPTPPNPTSSYFTNFQLKISSKTMTTRSDAIILLRQHVESGNDGCCVQTTCSPSRS
ncbi:zinc finger BED domain-containing protein 4-like [Drosophila serrata]|uniref:zinc finger BED domain-containing protein 4-like n=1 Tax=Drosophila serrata TaxID=7274 RepID=UPI000A1D075F|nr:zinc finger BED domain-containing protein 4-like [Drosophila serrata]